MQHGETAYPAWVLFTLAHDLPGVWLAHALDFDVMTQGESAEHAYRMAAEAVEMILEADLSDGVDPYSRRAPAKDWVPLFGLFAQGELLDRAEFLERLRNRPENSAFAVQMVFWVRNEERSELYDAPLAMMAPRALSNASAIA